MQNLARLTSERLAKQGIIPEKEVALYRYGFEALYFSLAELLSIMLVALVVGNFWETMLFFAAFIPLRVYAGGYHASTRLGCYLTSLGVYAGFTVVMKFIPAQSVVPFIVLGSILSLLIIWLYAPLVHNNHKVSQESRQRYRIRSRIICLAEILLIVMGLFLALDSRMILALLLGLLVEALSIMVVKSQSRMGGE